MFSVIFEVHPKSSLWNDYLALGKMLKPEFEQIDSFIENVRYRSLTREGWLVSLSQWRDEKALVRWRTRVKHHDVQERGRDHIFADYHLRIGELTHDTHPPAGHDLREQRLDETKTGLATTAILVSATCPEEWVRTACPENVAKSLGLDANNDGLVAWDVFEAVLVPGDTILLLSWRDRTVTELFQSKLLIREGSRVRCVRIIRDYGMFDRREAPQFYPDAEGSPTIHSSVSR